jgi:hypothetical protein
MGMDAALVGCREQYGKNGQDQNGECLEELLKDQAFSRSSPLTVGGGLAAVF